MRFEFIDLFGAKEMVEHPVPNEPINATNLHTSLYALFSISEGEVYTLARTKLDELGSVLTAKVIGDKWPPEKYNTDTIRAFADIILSA